MGWKGSEASLYVDVYIHPFVAKFASKVVFIRRTTKQKVFFLASISTGDHWVFAMNEIDSVLMPD